MGLADDLASQAAESVRRDRPAHPAGWEPGISWSGTHGTITSRPIAEPTPDWGELLRTWGFDPAVVEIVEPVQVRTWDAAIGNGEVRTMWYYRAAIRQRRASAPDIDELLRSIGKARKHPAIEDTEGAYILCLNDWQLGKGGTTATVERIQAAIDASVARVKELRRIGRRIDVIVLAGIGDIVENCDGHYAMQAWESELDMRAQRRLARRLIALAIEKHAPLVARILVPCAPGNHGENRKDGKAYTSFADNSDVEVFEGVAEAFSTREDYAHVSFLIPEGELTLTVQPVPDGPIVGLAHGHQARKGGAPLERIKGWVSGQAFGFRAMGDASIILVGHYHHYATEENGGRVIFIAPTIDSGSPWFRETAGSDSTPGMLSLLVTRDGWQDAQIL